MCYTVSLFSVVGKGKGKRGFV